MKTVATSLARSGVLARLGTAVTATASSPVSSTRAAAAVITTNVSVPETALSQADMIRPFSFSCVLITGSIAFPAMAATAAAAPRSHSLGAVRPFSTKDEDAPTLAEVVSTEPEYDDYLDNDDGGPITSSTAFNYSEDFSQMSNEELADPSTIPGWDLIHSPPRKFPRGALVGTVVSDKMQKTVNVAVDRYRMVPKIRKRRKYTRKFMAHDENELCSMGDVVMIVPCQKISKNKHFMVQEIIRAKGVL